MEKIEKNINEKAINEIYEEIAILNKNSLRVKKNSRLLMARNQKICNLYLLGESTSSIHKKILLTHSSVSKIIKDNKRILLKQTCKERFCSQCGKSFSPIKADNIFCSRRCYRKSYYREHLMEYRRSRIIRLMNKKDAILERKECNECKEFFKTSIKAKIYCSIKCRKIKHNRMVLESRIINK